MASPEYEAWITGVREASDIVEIVGRAVSLRRRGKQYWGLCPFHSEKTPSFSVDPERQLFYCFGCHAGGNVFTFLTQHEGLEFMDAVRRLAEDVGISEPQTKRERGANTDRGPLYEVMSWTQEYLQKDRSVIEPYLRDRQLVWGIAEHFQLGYAPNDWHGLVDWLSQHHVTEEVIVQAGVAVRREQGGLYDRWRHRLTFPIWDRRGKIVAFGGRALNADQEPKYLNSPETPLFQKGQLLYAMHLARPRWQQGVRPLLVEGYFDVVAFHAAGLTQAVASLGTALTESQARLLSRFHSEVDLCYDQDEAGQEASRRAFLILSSVGLRVNLVRLDPGVKDPDEFRQKFGNDRLSQAVDQSKPYVTVLADGLHAESPREKGLAVEKIRPLLLAVPDVVERSGYIELIARALRIDPSILTQSVEGSQAVKHTSGKNRHNMGRTGSEPTLPSVDVELLAALVRHPEAIEDVRRRLPDWVAQMGMERALQLMADEPVASIAAWIDQIEDGARALVLEGLTWHGPDGGMKAIDDFVEKIKERYDQERYHTLQDRARRGENEEALMREVLEATERLRQQKMRKEG